MKKKKTVLVPSISSKMKITILTDDNASVAHARLLGFSDDGVVVFEATGSAKREQGDPRDPVIAVEMALGRALRKMSRRMIRDANLRVQAATEEQQQMARARQRRNGKKRPGTNGKLHAVDYIREEWGQEAAERAATRRKHSI
jgi:hypothetical protein